MSETPFDETDVSSQDGASSLAEEAAVDSAANEESTPEVDKVAELTGDLQRLQAEYLNYKRRVDREKDLAKQRGRDEVLDSLLIVLDDIDRAAQHEELSGGFRAVADALRSATGKHGLEQFGETGEAFDPNFHEAISHAGESSDVTVTSLAQVLRQGFKVGERVLRPATVIVVDPASDSAPSEPVQAAAPEAAESADSAE